MTVNAIYRELTNTRIVIMFKASIVFKGWENEIPEDLMDRQIIIMCVRDNQLVITVR